MSNEYGRNAGGQGRGGHSGKDGFRKGPRGPHGGNDRRPGGKPHGERRDGERKPFGGKPHRDGDRKPYGDRSRDGERRSFGDRNRDERGGKRFGGDRERGPRRFDDRKGGKPFGERRDGRNFEQKPRERLHVDRGGRPGSTPFGKNAPRQPKQGDSDLLKELIGRLSGKSFNAYRDLEGTYAFDGYELSFVHTQPDPFAPPAKLTVRVPQDVAGFDGSLYDKPWRRIALEDRILREFGLALAKNTLDFADFIKGGTFSVSRPGPEVLERSACHIDDEALEVRFEAALPARDRSIAAREFEEMFFSTFPRIVRSSLLCVSYEEEALQAVADLADDQHAIREALGERGLAAFVADGAILPRENGVSDRPMAGGVPFSSPEKLRVEIETPHAGTIAGMGVPRGVTLIVGGGYHGKSTLLKAIESGVYDHVAGDGREFVICDATAVKLRAEDGRSVRGTDISLFINNLPNDVETESFWTDDASGSTSQAASTAEALEARSRLFLIDEDTSATNFMVREELMQAVVAPEGEPITPFVERLRDLYEKGGVSTILVAGSSGAFFGVADTIIKMESYKPEEITEAVRKICRERNASPVPRAKGFKLPAADRVIASPQHPLKIKTASEARKDDEQRREGRGPKGPEKLRVKVFGGVDMRVGSIGSDMRFVEQLVDPEQAKALACIVKACVERDLLSRMSVVETVETIWKELQEGGLQAVSGTARPECGLAMPRREEIYACINRLRHRD